MIKVFKSDLNSVAFSTESLNLYPLPDRFSESLSNYEEPASGESPDLFEDNHINDNRPRISGLVLLITQTCNLKCSYCFAEPYMRSHSDTHVMSPATAGVAIEKVVRSVPQITWVQFFGGEPLIGFAAIKEAVQASERYCIDHQAQMPVFTIFTNGTLIDKKVIGFFKAYNFSVTISLDGPRRINDKQRQFPSGRGTFDVIKKKIDLLRDAGVEVRIEAVFTNNHKRYEETIESTYEFLLKCGARDICLTPAIGGSAGESLDKDFLAGLEQDYTASTERIMDSWLTESPIKLPYWFDILNTLISRKGKTHFCGAGYKGITVSCSGKVFPCYAVIGDSLYMGNVYDKEFPGEDFRRVTELMRRTSKDSFPKCVNCWAKKLCSPCYGDTFSECGTLSAPHESLCVKIRSVARATLLKVAEFMTDDEKWKRFAENFNQLSAHFDNDCKDNKFLT
jgi:uncharacterized protein